MIYHNCVYCIPIKELSTILIKYRQGSILIPKPLKCLFLYQIGFAIVTNIVSNIYRNINKFLPNAIIWENDHWLCGIPNNSCVSLISKTHKMDKTPQKHVPTTVVGIPVVIYTLDAPTYCVARLHWANLANAKVGQGRAEGAILPYVRHLQLISTLKIGANCCHQCQYKLTKPNQTQPTVT